MSIDAPPEGPSVEELQRLVIDPFEPKDKFCHWLDDQRPGYRLCGQRSIGKHTGGHSQPSLPEIMETGYCSCGKLKCPTCLRVYLWRNLWAPKKKHWWRR